MSESECLFRKMAKKVEEEKEVCLGKLIHEFVPKHSIAEDRCMIFPDEFEPLFIFGFTEDTKESFEELFNCYGFRLYLSRRIGRFFLTVGSAEKPGLLEVVVLPEEVIEEMKRKECQKCKYRSECRAMIIRGKGRKRLIEIISYGINLF